MITKTFEPKDVAVQPIKVTKLERVASILG